MVRFPGIQLPNKLQKAEVPLRFGKACADLDQTGRFNGSTMLCAGGLDASACFGDSGGPMVRNGVQIGLAGETFELLGTRCHTQFPFYYAKVSVYLLWILENIDSI